MNYLQAIKLLAPFHAAKLVACYSTSLGLTAQLSTGLPSNPFIAVNDSTVLSSDLFEVLDQYYAETSPLYCESAVNLLQNTSNLLDSSEELSLFGYELLAH